MISGIKIDFFLFWITKESPTFTSPDLIPKNEGFLIEEDMRLFLNWTSDTFTLRGCCSYNIPPYYPR